MSSSNEFTYFAYGSNMSVRRLVARLPSARVVTTGFMPGYTLAFDNSLSNSILRYSVARKTAGPGNSPQSKAQK